MARLSIQYYTVNTSVFYIAGRIDTTRCFFPWTGMSLRLCCKSRLWLSGAGESLLLRQERRASNNPIQKIGII